MANQSEGNKHGMLQGVKKLLQTENFYEFSTDDIPKLIQELRIHQIELEMQNEELRRAQIEIEESRNKYAHLYDFAPVGYFTLSKKTLILEANLTGAALLGIERNYLRNKRFTHYIAKEDQNAFYSYRKRLIETSSPQSCELKMLKDDGTLFHTELKGIAVFNSAGELSQYRLAVLDIAQKKRTEIMLQENLAQLSKRRRYESIITSVTQSVHQSIELKEVMENAVKALNENIEDTDFVSIYMVEGEEAVLMAYKGFPNQYVERAGRIPYGRGTTWKTIIEGKTRYVPDVDQDTVIGPAGRDIGTKSYLSTPINYAGKAIGTLNINSLKKDAFDEEELKLLEIVAKQIEIAINNAHQAELLRVSREDYRQLFEDVPVGVYRTTPGGRVIIANSALIGIPGYSSFDELASHNLEDEEFSVKYSRAKFKEVIERDGEVRGLESVWIKKDGSKVHVSENARAIRAEDGAVLYYEGTVEDITKRKKREELLQENLAQLDKKNRYESIISCINRSIHSSIKLQEVLDNAVDAMFKNIKDIDNVYISLVEGKDAVLKAFRGYPTWFIERVSKIPYPEGVTWDVIIEGKPKYVADTDKDTIEEPARIEAGAKSYLSIPLEFGDKTVGVININSSKKEAFKEEELKLLETIAKQIETAISNAKQAEELRESREKFRLLVEGVKDYAIYMLDTEGYIVSWNMGAERIKGYKAEEIIGKHFSIFYPTEDVERGKPEYKLKIARDEGRVEDEGWHIRKDGTRFWADVVITALRDETGHLRGFVKITRDISERKQAEELLRKAKEELEQRVVNRTKELAESNENLKKEVAWHKWAEDMLRASEERYRVLYDENPSMYFTINKDGKILSVNQFGAQRLGFSTHELIGQSVLNIIHEADSKEALNKIRHCFEEQWKFIHWEFRKVHKNGSLMWVRESARAVQNIDGSVVALIVSEDISDRKRMEDALHRHSEILDLANDTILIRDIEDKIIYWNQGAEWTYGWTKEEAIGRNVHDLLQTKFPESLEKIREKLYNDEYWEGEVIHIKRDGTQITVSSRWTLQPATEENPTVILEINNDITERKQVEEKIRLQMELYEAILKAQSDVGECFIIVEDERIIYSNEACDQIGGYCSGDLTSLPSFFELVIPEQRTFLRYQLNRLLKNKSMERKYEIGVLKKNGERVDLEIAVHPLQLIGKHTQLIIIGRDISERKRTEEALRESEERFRILADSAPVLIWVNGPEGCQFVNREYAEFFGYPVEELLGYGWTKFVHPEDYERYVEGYKETAEKREPFTAEVRIRHADGQWRWLLSRGLPRFTPSGQFIGYVGCSTDITYRKRAEEELKASVKEKEILLKEIHHRVKNNLQIIHSLLSMQSRRIKDKEIREELNDSQNRIKAMSLIHERLYKSGNISVVDFSKYAKNLSNNLVRSYETGSKIKLKISADEVLLPIDKAIPCGLILNELISNSLKHAFLPGKDGEIRIYIYPDSSSKKSPESGSYTLIIGNNGVEFPKDLDFRSAKSLGLQLVCSLTKQLNGTIELDRSSGTEFRITFPA